MNIIEAVVPMPENEIERLVSLSELDIDYTNQKETLQHLSSLAARVAGVPISLINLIDAFNQWTISSHGLSIEQMPREESICQYTIVGKEPFEVKNLTEDYRFKDRSYVTGEPNIRYYFGIPLVTNDGHNLGALCVFDRVEREISPEKIDLLKLIAREVMNRLAVINVIEDLKSQVSDATAVKVKVAHDIRGPLSGITSLAKFITEQGDSNKLDDVLQLVNMIYKSGNSLLELAEEILGTEKKLQPQLTQVPEFNLSAFKDKLIKLYKPQTLSKHLEFEVFIHPEKGLTPISKNKLLQITGNLVSNAIKFTTEFGKITVQLDVVRNESENMLHIVVTDTGIGLDEASIAAILNGDNCTTKGTSGEKGYGFGLALVKHLVYNLKGTMEIYSKPNEGTTFQIKLPQ